MIDPKYIEDELKAVYKSINTDPKDVAKAERTGDRLLMHNFPSTGPPGVPGPQSPTVVEDIKSKFIKKTSQYSKKQDLNTAPPDPIDAMVNMAVLEGIRKAQRAQITDIIYIDGKPFTYAQAGKNANLAKRIRDLIKSNLSKEATAKASDQGVGWGVGAALGSLAHGQIFTPSQMALTLTTLTNPAIASKLGISLGKAAKSGSKKLDKIKSSPIPGTARMVTREPKEGDGIKRYPFGQELEGKKYPFGEQEVSKPYPF